MSSMKMTINSSRSFLCSLTNTSTLWKCSSKCSKMEKSIKKICRKMKRKSRWISTPLSSWCRGSKLKLKTKEKRTRSKMKMIFWFSNYKASLQPTKVSKIPLKKKSLTRTWTKSRSTRSLFKNCRSTSRATTEMNWSSRFLRTILFNSFNLPSSFKDPRTPTILPTCRSRARMSSLISTKLSLNLQLSSRTESRGRSYLLNQILKSNDFNNRTLKVQYSFQMANRKSQSN